TRQIGSVAGDIDAGEHQFAITARNEPPRLRDRLIDRQRARIAAPERNYAERTAMVAAVLHLQEGAGMTLDTVDIMDRVPLLRHYVADRDAPAVVAPRMRVEFFGVAEHAIDLGHGRERRRFGLRRAAGNHNARAGPLAPDTADILARLAHRFRRHRAGVHHHCVAEPGGRAPNRFRLGDVEPAAESDHIDAHAAPALNKAGSKRPSNSNATVPVIST